MRATEIAEPLEVNKIGIHKLGENENNVCWTVCANKKVYTYDEAINLAGNGWYNIGLLATLSLALIAMSLDMFGFAVVVSMSSCELHLDQSKKTVLVSMPFVGPIIMAYAWGYISDTRGRKKTLVVAMWVSFVVSILSAFSPHWIILAVCRLVSTCFCSCAQSVAFAHLGESCSARVKGSYLLIMASTMHLNMSINYGLAYLLEIYDFSFDLGFIYFLPWRLLALILALPLGLCGLLLLFFYESPKYLLNAGHEGQAIEILRNICRRNGADLEKFQVEKLVLNEEGNLQRKDTSSMLESLWDQTSPLFKPPLLQRTLLLYYLLFVIFSTCSSLTMWLPTLAKYFTEGLNNPGDETQGLCGMIVNSQSTNVTNTSHGVPCKATIIGAPVVIAACGAGATFSILSALISKLSSRKRMLMIVVFLVTALAAAGTILIPNNVSNIMLYLGTMLTCLNAGVIALYWVELYPTSYRGMASCLGVMVARISGIVGINVVGPIVVSHCSFTFYGICALVFSGTMMAFLLPSDRPKKV